jgi:tetratricopeptide (TPR) repeat protein
MYMFVERPRLLAGRALVLYAKGDGEKALAAAKEGLAFVEEKKMRHMMSLVNLALGRIYAGLERHDEALAALRNALEAAEALGMRPDKVRALHSMAGVLEQTGRADEAAASRTQARQMIEEIAAGFEDETLRQAYLESAAQAEI